MSEENDPQVSITPSQDGPLIVRNLPSMQNKDGEMAVKPTMALCRCGQSSKKPFCDGTHKSIGFSSNKSEDRVEDKLESYSGSSITIHDNRGICAHAGHCTDRLSSVFRLRQEPWIDPDGASADQIIAAVEACPSGALSYTVGGVEQPPSAGSATIRIDRNGPYIVSGAVDLTDTERAQGSRGSGFTLCRCGGSKNKPFCDGSHWYDKFTDDNN